MSVDYRLQKWLRVEGATRFRFHIANFRIDRWSRAKTSGRRGSPKSATSGTKLAGLPLNEVPIRNRDFALLSRELPAVGAILDRLPNIRVAGGQVSDESGGAWPARIPAMVAGSAG